MSCHSEPGSLMVYIHPSWSRYLGYIPNDATEYLRELWRMIEGMKHYQFSTMLYGVFACFKPAGLLAADTAVRIWPFVIVKPFESLDRSTKLYYEWIQNECQKLRKNTLQHWTPTTYKLSNTFIYDYFWQYCDLPHTKGYINSTT